jgi:hypothetical protein
MEIASDGSNGSFMVEENKAISDCDAIELILAAN